MPAEDGPLRFVLVDDAEYCDAQTGRCAPGEVVTQVDLNELSTSVLPYVSAVAGAYGSAVLDKVKDAAAEDGADATVSWGRKLLSRLFAGKRGEKVSDAVRELAADPADEASLALVRAQILKALTEEPSLATEVRELLQAATPAGDQYQVIITRSQGIQIGSRNTQTNTYPPLGD
ncbi:hypothetical protein ACWT_4707 [Actinoplanes sp. SE50]|uniref:RIP homotypic interaction motif-containing protein n=1 Tax=unclassified Actinoplanes TaxID=2626549 RepID=UPI00023EBD8F|nr:MULTISPECIES: RIP homotypic interaction motif-containing protein [unclassified Actinoplanes]AEV85729.1 hypothetical protein ACPL_4838 [Actinoplanes sp. SE50/110]ATO84122.1 hypothetical protein ACWT_4707 [Actinoplanes sp. SE50]SLM01532.1 uncharacterized protein ACSP50_4768 [Actinoplanes sp. SE50/110]